MNPDNYMEFRELEYEENNKIYDNINESESIKCKN